LEEVDDGHAVVGGDEDTFGHKPLLDKVPVSCGTWGWFCFEMQILH
jgi:hypothetical protein